MSITSKFIYAKTRSGFEEKINTIPDNLKPIVFIEDTRELWTMGTYFSLGYPSIQVNEISGKVQIKIGQETLTLEVSGETLSVKKGQGNTVIVSSNALSKIDTDSPLKWDNSSKKLIHLPSTAIPGSYGQSLQLSNASVISVPYITVDIYGHISEVSTKTVSIRDYVEQIQPDDIEGERNVLLSYNENNNASDTAQVRKARGLTYNNLSQVLAVEGGIVARGNTEVSGDLTVKDGDIIGNLRGNVTGEATPKIHLSETPEYGGASLNLYGHVRLEDNLGIEAPSPSSNNVDTNSSSVLNGVAASPLMVWKVREELQKNINDKPFLGGIDVNEKSINIVSKDQRLNISADKGVSVDIINNGLIIKGVEIKAYNENNNLKVINNNLLLSEDFIIDEDNELSIRWKTINQ